MTFKLSEAIAPDVFPHSGSVAFGPQTLNFTYRDIPMDWVERVYEIVGSEAEEAGLPAKALIRLVLHGENPIGEDAIALEDAAEAARVGGEQERKGMEHLTQKVLGAAVSCLVGDWDADEPVSAEACAKLPPSLAKALIAASAGVTLSVEKKSSFARLPRS